MTAPKITHYNLLSHRYEPDEEPGLEDTETETHQFLQSDDKRVLVASRKYPEGAAFVVEGGYPYAEAFYIVAGEVSCTPAGAETLVFTPGTVIHYPPHLEARWEYTPGSHHLAFFWGEDPLDPVAGS